MARRELQLIRQEGGDNGRSQQSVSTQRSEARSASVATVSIKAIGELLSNFEGREDTFWRWRQQLELLMAICNLDENTAPY